MIIQHRRVYTILFALQVIKSLFKSGIQIKLFLKKIIMNSRNVLRLRLGLICNWFDRIENKKFSLWLIIVSVNVKKIEFVFAVFDQLALNVNIFLLIYSKWGSWLLQITILNRFILLMRH